MEGLKAGMKSTASLKVERKHCTSRGGPWVFSTPEMVKFSDDLVKQHRAQCKPRKSEGTSREPLRTP